MATGSKRTKVSNLVVDISQGRQLRIMEDTLKMILSPYVEKLSKDRNWYSPLLALVGVITALIKFDYSGLIKTKGVNEFDGFDITLVVCLAIYVLLLVVCLILFSISLYNIYKYRKDNLSVHGIVEDIMSFHADGNDEQSSQEAP